MRRVLITGFEPYGDYPENSSWEVAQRVAFSGVEGVETAVEQMPVSFGRVAAALHAAIEKHNPNLVLLLGQSGGSDRVKLERVALNRMDARMADNDGFIPDDEPIAEAGEAAYFTRLPIKQLRTAIEQQGIAVKISNSAGLYVCNRLYYEAMRICREHPAMQAIFVHLPFYEGQPSAKPDKPTMPLDEMVRAIQTIINEVKP